MYLRTRLMTSAATLLAATALTATAYAQDAKSLAEPNKDWETFHGSYKDWNYSPLKQINTENVKKLKVAFIEQVGRSTRGLETTPLAKDGILYYSGSYSKVFAVKGDTGTSCGPTFPSSTRRLSRARPTRPSTAAWRWATATCTSAPLTDD